jgi:hypothetical protein
MTDDAAKKLDGFIDKISDIKDYYSYRWDSKNTKYVCVVWKGEDPFYFDVDLKVVRDLYFHRDQQDLRRFLLQIKIQRLVNTL